MNPSNTSCRLTILACALAGVMSVGFWAAGCGTANPALVADLVNQAAINITGTGGDGGTTPPGGGGFGGTDVCDLPDDQRKVRISITNESRAEVDFALVLLTTAGDGGFVCADERANYIDGDYESEPLTGNTKTFGCDTVTLDRGTEMLVARFAQTLPAVTDGSEAIVAAPPLDGSTDIPLPNIILLGDDESPTRFGCTSSADPCSQGGFIYTAGSIILVSASRTQGTLCNTRVSPRPRWVLADPTQIDRLARAFEFVKGGDVRITILDRASNTDRTVNQVVWQVLDSDGRVIHEEAR